MLPVIGFLIAEQSFGRYRHDTRLNTCFRQFSRPFHEGSYFRSAGQHHHVRLAFTVADNISAFHDPARFFTAITACGRQVDDTLTRENERRRAILFEGNFPCINRFFGVGRTQNNHSAFPLVIVQMLQQA